MLVAGTGVVSDNWDTALVAVVVGLAAGVDLLRCLRPGDFVVAGPDALVSRVRGRTTSTPWSSVVGVEHRRGRWGRWRVVLLTGGRPVRLPDQVPVAWLRAWVDGPPGETH